MAVPLREVSTGAPMAPWWLAVRLLEPLTFARAGTSRRLPDRALTDAATPAAVSVKLVTPGRLIRAPPVAVTRVPSVTVVPVAVNVVPDPWAVSADAPVIVSLASICDAPLVTVSDAPE